MDLEVRTVTSPDHGSLLEKLGSRHPLAFVREGDGIVGLGEALRLEFTGPSRITDASAAWRSLVQRSTVVDAVRLPGSGLVALGSFAFADSSAATSVLIVPRVILGRRDGVSWTTHISTPPDDEPTGEPFTASFVEGALDASGYKLAVAEAVRRVVLHQARKVVLARDVVARIRPDADLRLPLRRLADSYPDTFTFSVAGLMGSSPETLVRSHEGVVTARVLAGSAARGSDETADAEAAAALAASHKDVNEHSYAIRSVIEGLAPLSTDVTSTAPYPLPLPNLWHLASDVTGTLTSGSSVLDLVAALHPTAAVGGTPTAAAIGIIEALEPFDRGRYAGPVGWIDGNGDGEWAVALRCAQVDGDRVTAYAGAGIVAGSDPSRELAETALKLRPIVDAFR